MFILHSVGIKINKLFLLTAASVNVIQMKRKMSKLSTTCVDRTSRNFMFYGFIYALLQSLSESRFAFAKTKRF